MNSHLLRRKTAGRSRILTALVFGLGTSVALTGCETPTGEASRPLSDAPAFSQVAKTDANLQTSNASAGLTNTSFSTWSLSKVGNLSVSPPTITWTVTATQIATVSGRLTVNGILTLTNAGSSMATLGNAIVNLQTKSGSQWITRATDVADATNGNAATSAHVVAAASSENLPLFAENLASGDLNFVDAGTSAPFVLVPEQSIVGGGSRTLLFSASYDNNVLNLATGTPVRAELIITFGNAPSSASGAANIDINGNGVIDADEAHVRSVAIRLGVTVPALVTLPNPTLADALSDIAATGTVTISNPVFNLGSTGGTVSVDYAGGASGGDVTNCAHLTRAPTTTTVGTVSFQNLDGIKIDACDTQTIAAQAQPPHILSPADGDATGIAVTITYDVGGAASLHCTVTLSNGLSFDAPCDLGGSVSFNFAPGSNTFSVTGFDGTGAEIGTDAVTWTVSTPTDYPGAMVSLFTGRQILAINANARSLPTGNIPIVVLRNSDNSVSLGCDPAEYAAANVTGKIVVVHRGFCTRAERAIYGQQAGAVAVIMINDRTGLPPFEGDIFGNPTDGTSYFVNIPFLGISISDGLSLIAADGGTVVLAATTVSAASVGP